MTSAKYRYVDSPWVKLDLKWDMLTDGLIPMRFEKGHVFYVEEESVPNVYIIKSGRVAMYINSGEGRMKTVLTLDEGCMFGNLSLFDDDSNNSCGAMQVSDESEIYTVPKRLVLERMEKDPSIAHNIMLENTRIVRMLVKQVELLSFRSGEARVCFYLLHMAKEYTDEGKSKNSKQRQINMRFTHQDIADVTGLSRVSVSNVMSGLIKGKIIAKKGGYYTILNIAALEERATE